MATSHDVVVFPGEAIVPLEAVAKSLGAPGTTALNLVTSPYGRFFGAWLTEGGARVLKIEAEPGSPVTPEQVAGVLDAHPEISLVSFVHVEAISGVRNDAEAIARVAHEHGAIVAMDAVASFGAHDVPIDRWEWRSS